MWSSLCWNTLQKKLLQTVLIQRIWNKIAYRCKHLLNYTVHIEVKIIFLLSAVFKKNHDFYLIILL